MLNRFFYVFLCLFLLVGCQSAKKMNQNKYDKITVSVLPFVNHTHSAMLSNQVRKIILVQLPSYGVATADVATSNPWKNKDMDVYTQQKVVKHWLHLHNVDFAITGSINEWGINQNKKPHLSLKLEIRDLSTNKIVWDTYGSRQGKKGEDFFMVCRTLIKNLLKSMPTLTKKR